LSAVAAVAGFFVSLAALKAAKRQAEATEDPPIAQPVEGGVKSNNPQDIPEVKAPEAAPTESTETVVEKDITAASVKSGEINKGDTRKQKTTKSGDQTVIETTTKTRKGETTVKKETVPPLSHAP
jgi:hypothetical protein